MTCRSMELQRQRGSTRKANGRRFIYGLFLGLFHGWGNKETQTTYDKQFVASSKVFVKKSLTADVVYDDSPKNLVLITKKLCRACLLVDSLSISYYLD